MTDDELAEYAADTPAKYAAQDENGEWWMYEIKPYILEVNRSWDSDGWQSWATMGKVPAGHDWRTTLREVKPMTTTPNAPTWPARPQPEQDPINPSHYRAGKVECIDALEAATVNKHGIEAVCTANAIKYLWRYETRGGLEDVRKARWYLELLENHLSN